MANPVHHALSSVKKWGGLMTDYLPIHQFFDQTKSATGDFRHRAILHNSFGIFLCEQVFGPAIELSTCRACGKVATEHDPGGHAFRAKIVPTRWVGEQHVIEDMGRIIPLNEWVECIQPEPWMNRPVKLSRELARDEKAETLAKEVSV